MDIWKYTPGFVARPVISGLKNIRRTNENRRKFLDLRRDSDVLEDMLIESNQTATMMASNNEGLKVEIATQNMRLDATASAFKELKNSHQEHVAAMLTGDKTYIRAEGASEVLNINEGLVSLARQAQSENGATQEENENLKQANFKYRVAAAVGNANIGKYPAFAYVDGHVYGTPAFNKYRDKNFSIEMGLENDAELATALSEGKGVEREYDGMKVVFLSRKKVKDVEVGYIIPDKRTSRMKLFVEVGVNAAKQLRKSLRKDPDYGGISFA